jgi:hypothetical protein
MSANENATATCREFKNGWASPEPCGNPLPCERHGVRKCGCPYHDCDGDVSEMRHLGLCMKCCSTPCYELGSTPPVEAEVRPLTPAENLVAWVREHVCHALCDLGQEIAHVNYRLLLATIDSRDERLETLRQTVTDRDEQIATLQRKLAAATQQQREFPVMLPRGSRRMIPWAIGVEAWQEYAKKHGTSQSVERIAERGGFGEGEMDEFVPTWRERTDTIRTLESRLAAAEAERDAAISRADETWRMFTDEVSAALAACKSLIAERDKLREMHAEHCAYVNCATRRSELRNDAAKMEKSSKGNGA